MAAQNTALLEDTALSIPAGSHELPGFRRWAASPEFPQSGRIDFLAGTLEIDMSPEDLYTHGAVKTEIATQLQLAITHRDLGSVFVDRARLSSVPGGLSAEPDVVVVLWSSIAEGRVREVPAAGGGPGRFIELDGAPDLVVEVVSDGSLSKDTRRLPKLYAAAGIPELWLADARGPEVDFKIFDLGTGQYRQSPQAAEGWTHSRLLNGQVRLTRKLSPFGRPSYRLEMRQSA